MTAAGLPRVAELSELLEADGLVLYAIEGQDLTIVDMEPTHPAASSLRLQVGFGVVGRVARTGKPVLIDVDSPRNAIHRQLLGLSPQQTLARMCVPLVGLDTHTVGVLAAHRSPARPFGQAELDIVDSVATTLGLWLHAGQLFRAVNRHRTERDRLIKQAISAQEAERRRIAFDLHDGVTTALASMSFHLSAADLSVSELASSGDDVAGRHHDVERAKAELVTARALADLAYDQTRAAISGLHSMVLDDLGLVAAIESLVHMATREEGPRIDLVVDPQVAQLRPPDHAAAALYRIAQEALANAVKHSGAKRIVVSLRRVGDSMVFGCTDDGVGFDQEEQRAARAGDAAGAQHFGLSSVAERCAMVDASLRIESVPGRGTTVLVDLPL